MKRRRNDVRLQSRAAKEAPSGCKPERAGLRRSSSHNPAELFFGSNPSAQHAFSLIELLAVVAILLILTSLYWGTNVESAQKRKLKACQDNLDRIYMALQVYAADQSSKFPCLNAAKNSGEALSLLVPHYTVETSVFICPASKDPALPESESFTNHPISYAYYMGRTSTNSEVLITDKQVDALAKRPGQPVFSADGKPPGNNHGKAGGNFLFCDGHVEASPATSPYGLPLTPGVVLLNP
jgi:prepilin-type N-terminal cleavage/methylation domain-containing protein/prepilin-type processing-associated H-X9-DG protein